MLTNLQKGIFLILIWTIVISCANSENNAIGKSNNTKNDILLNRALVNGYYSQLTDSIGVSIYNNKIYMLSGAKNGFNKENFLLHFVKEDNTFVNKDFKLSEHQIDSSLFNKFNKLSVLQIPIIDVDFKKIRLGQYIRLEDKSTKNIWVKELRNNMINANNSCYNNQFKYLLNKNLIQESFELTLQFGTFFKNSHGFYILYGDDFIYIITDRSNELKDKFMLHFIDEKNNFINKSFLLDEQNFQNQLEDPYSNLNINRIPLPDEAFIKIRIGQFNDNGNLWTQEFAPNDILKNPLLKYAKEFE